MPNSPSLRAWYDENDVIPSMAYWKSSEEKDTRATLFHGDCIQVMGGLYSNSVDLVFADPPFNIGYEYDQYDDYKTKTDYLEFCQKWLAECRRILKPEGSIYVAIGIKYQAELKILMDEAGFHWRDTVVWHYTFGPKQSKKFTPSWVAIHYATVASGNRAGGGKQWTWNGDAINVPSARQLKYRDKRAVAGGKTPDNVWVLLPHEYEGCFLPWQNAMLESRVAGTFKERTSHPCQMPEAVLERILKVSSNPGDLVLDPFAGSGTTCAVALKLGRRTWGIELSEDYLDSIIIPRLSKVHREMTRQLRGNGMQAKKVRE